MERRARALRDLDHLADGVEDARALVADVRDERRAELAPPPRPPRRAPPCRRRRPGCRRVRTRASARPPRMRAGSRGTSPRRSAVADLPDRPVRRRRDERQSGRGLSASRYSANVVHVHSGGPSPSSARRYARRASRSSDRRGREAVGADHLGREALEDLRREQRIVERLERRVRVEVDEPGQSSSPSASTTSPSTRWRRSRRCARPPRRRPRGTTGRRPGRPRHLGRRALRGRRAGRRRRTGSAR